jgi:hypothetical protein
MENVWAPGARVRIRASKLQGSARLLHGLTGTVIGPHPIATGWVKIVLDPNPVTPYGEWPVASDRLVAEHDRSTVPVNAGPGMIFP